MEPNEVEKKEKEYIALRKRRDEISDIKRKLPWTKLDIPIQDGWILNLKLIPEAERREDGERMAQALAMCDKGFYIKKGQSKLVSQLRKDTPFSKMKDYFTRVSWDGKLIYVGPEIFPIKPKDYEKLSEGMKKFFSEVVNVHTSRWGGQKHTEVKYVLNIPEYYICIKIKKRMLTMVQEIDTKLLKEEAYVDKKLEPYYRTSPGSSGKRWRNIDWSARRVRRHSKDALQHIKKGEISSVSSYNKLNKGKKL